MAEDESPSIHVLMSRVMQEVGAIGKTGWNDQQKFQFRGIDAVMGALHPALVKHGVFFVPNVVDRDRRDFTTKKGTEMEAVHLHVKFVFYGPRGDSVVCSAWGESADSGDKATGKAMSMALKYALLQTFCVPTEDQEDPDATTVEPGRSQADVLRERIAERADNEGRPRPDVAAAFLATYGEEIREASEENLRAFLSAPWVDKADDEKSDDGTRRGKVMVEHGSAEAPLSTIAPPPGKTPEEFRDALLAAETKADVRRILRDVGLAGHSDAEVTNAKGESLGSLTTLATRLMKELAS